MQILKTCSIKDRHSFHTEALAEYWAEYDSVDELRAILTDAREFGLPIMPVGSGSNLLFAGNYPGILLHSRIQETTVLEDLGNDLILKVGAGRNWDDLVAWTVSQGWGNLQNLSGIPSEVGATPVQNIGAYGVEAKDVISAVEVLDRESLETLVLSPDDCRFGYRDSRFKHDWKDKYIITYVHFRLSRQPEYILSYGALAERIDTKGDVKSSLELIRQTIISIRNEKLPDPAQTGNAGSFFMNPEVEEQDYSRLREKWPDLPAWALTGSRYKISAAWLIDKCGWKGRRIGDAGVWPRQPLVLVNYGKASGSEIIDLSNQIIRDVKDRFGLVLRPEVIVLGAE